MNDLKFVNEIVRDGFIFASAISGVFLIKYMKKGNIDKSLRNYEILSNSPIATQLINLQKFSENKEFDELMKLCEYVLKEQTSQNQFLVNRQIGRINNTIQSICNRVKRSRNDKNALQAFDFEKDDLPFIEAYFESIMYNLMLDN